MAQESIEQLLRSLPKNEASDFFTPRVMAHVRAKGNASALPRFRRAGALAALATVAALAGWMGVERNQRAEEVRMLAEQQHISRELEEIKRLTAELEPVVYVGSTQNYDYFIDLHNIQDEHARVQPAAYRPELQPGL